MDLYLLKVKHIYDEEFEECGIFSSKNKDGKGEEKIFGYEKEGFF